MHGNSADSITIKSYIIYSPYGYETAAHTHTFSVEGPGNMQVSRLHEDSCR